MATPKYLAKKGKNGFYAQFIGRKGQMLFKTPIKPTLADLKVLVSEIQTEAPMGQLTMETAIV